MHTIPHSQAHGHLFATWSQLTQKLSNMEMSALFGRDKSVYLSTDNSNIMN